MAQFSVKDGIQFSLSAYGRHFVLLLSASALVAGSYWLATVAPRFVAEKLGVHQVLDIDMVTVMQDPQDQATDQSRMVLQKVQEITAKISTHLQAAPKHLLALVLLVFLLVWGLYLILVLGMMKLGLSIKDKDSGSLAILLEVSASQVMRFIGASLIFGLYFISALIGMAVLTIPFAILCKGLLGEGVRIFLSVSLWLVLAVAMLSWLVRYTFYGYCIVDKANVGAREALRMSRDISHGSRRRVIAAVAFMAIVGIVVMFLAHKAIAMSGCACSLAQKNMIASLVIMIVTYPFSIPFFSYMYRSLSTKSR